ncbi:MAG: MarR family transcriptional regulator [Burkholderiaceae bacterium]|nr:MarR family transcriptional regulator [Burkholderiaceae bacterium]
MSTATPRKTPPPGEGAGGGERPDVAGHEKKAHGALQKLREIIKTAQEQFQSTTERAGVSGSQAWALSEIATRPGMIVSELGKAMAIHPSTTSNMLDKMQKRGLIRRERIDSDQRVVRLFLTDDGASLLRELPGPARGLLPDALGRLSDDELDHVDAALGLILEKLERRGAYTPLASMIAKRDRNGAATARAGADRR